MVQKQCTSFLKNNPPPSPQWTTKNVSSEVKINYVVFDKYLSNRLHFPRLSHK